MLLEFDFDERRQRFRYDDDEFRLTDRPYYARGWRAETRDGDGYLKMVLGGRNNADIEGMSGGWSRKFNVDEASSGTVSFSVKLTQSPDYERDEYSEVLVAIDGKLIGTDGNAYVARVRGNGEDGGRISTGWLDVTLDLGELAPGKHTLTFGGYNNQKTSRTEVTRIAFDDVKIATGAPLDDFEAEVLRLVNDYRVERGRDPLQADARLSAAAEAWSREMARGDFFEHGSREGVEERGYDLAAWAENIAAGYRSPEDVVDAWIDSPGHRENLLKRNVDETGIGYFYREDDGGDAPYGHYWTQNFATEDDALI